MKTMKHVFIALLVFILYCEKQSTDLNTDIEPIGKMSMHR